MLKEILWKNQPRWQMIGAMVGTFIGILLLLFSVQTFSDIRQILYGGQTEGEDIVLINKKVTLVNTFGAKSVFSEEDIELLSSQAFIKDVARFTSNQYKLSAVSRTLGFYTELFFEALPDEYVDAPAKWSWKEGDKEVPIILSRDYLALYNFGFAPSQGLPQFTPSAIRRVRFELILDGNGMKKSFTGRIAGFSDRINSILVPKDFLDWSNKRFGLQQQEEYSRLLLVLTNPYSQELEDFLSENGMEVSTGKFVGSKLRYILRLIITIVMVIGMIIVFLSMLVFVLNYQLIISRSAERIRLLFQLGYREKALSSLLKRQFNRVFMVASVSAALVFFILHFVISRWLSSSGFTVSPYPSLAVLVVLIVSITAILAFNHVTIAKNIKKLAS